MIRENIRLEYVRNIFNKCLLRCLLAHLVEKVSSQNSRPMATAFLDDVPDVATRQRIL